MVYPTKVIAQTLGLKVGDDEIPALEKDLLPLLDMIRSSVSLDLADWEPAISFRPPSTRKEGELND